MSTQLEETATHFVVSTLASVGREKMRPRGHVKIPKGDRAALTDEITKQAVAARRKVGLTPE